MVTTHEHHGPIREKHLYSTKLSIVCSCGHQTYIFVISFRFWFLFIVSFLNASKSCFSGRGGCGGYTFNNWVSAMSLSLSLYIYRYIVWCVGLCDSFLCISVQKLKTNINCPLGTIYTCVGVEQSLWNVTAFHILIIIEDFSWAMIGSRERIQCGQPTTTTIFFFFNFEWFSLLLLANKHKYLHIFIFVHIL